MNIILNRVKKPFQVFYDWLFSDVDLRRLALFRIVVSLSLLSMYIPRQFNFFNDFYGPDGLAPRNLALKLFETFYRPPFEWFFWPDSMNSIMHLGLIFALIFVLFGVGGRVLIFIAWLLDIAFIHRNYSIIFGADLMGAIWLFYLMFTQASSTLSLSGIFKKNIHIKPAPADIVSQVFFRLMQIQICTIYIFTGFEKLRGASWWDGSALWTVLGNTQMVTMDFSWLRHFPLVIGIMTFSTILFEIYFSVFIWMEKYKKLIIIAGVLFHTGIAISMNLYQFSAIMMGTYFFFVDAGILDFCSNSLRKINKNISF